MSKLKEPMVAYEVRGAVQQVQASVSSVKSLKKGGGNGQNSDVTILIGSLRKPANQLTALEKMEGLRAGISKKDLEHLKAKTALDYDQLAHVLSVTRATLINKKGTEKFNDGLSERIIGLAEIYSYGYEVFGNEAHFNRWMFRANAALGGLSPYDVCDNQFGREEVKNIIGRIEYGVYS